MTPSLSSREMKEECECVKVLRHSKAVDSGSLHLRRGGGVKSGGKVKINGSLIFDKYRSSNDDT